jgi:hypothetical protein
VVLAIRRPGALRGDADGREIFGTSLPPTTVVLTSG